MIIKEQKGHGDTLRQLIKDMRLSVNDLSSMNEQSQSQRFQDDASGEMAAISFVMKRKKVN